MLSVELFRSPALADVLVWGQRSVLGVGQQLTFIEQVRCIQGVHFLCECTCGVVYMRS